MNIVRVLCCTFLVTILSAYGIAAQTNTLIQNNVAYPTGEAVMQSQSTVEWNTSRFLSTISIDLKAAHISMPAGRGTAVDRINMELPVLIKDKLLSLLLDSSTMLDDAIVQGTVTLSELTDIIDNGKKTPSFFSSDMKKLSIDHSIHLADIGSLFIHHTKPYKPQKSLSTIATRPYTGIIIDARGALPVQGEFVTSLASPAFFPKIWDENMNLLYEKNMVLPDVAKKYGVVTYSSSTDESVYVDRVGTDPLRIVARKLFGINRTDPVISRSDALRILSSDANIELLTQGRVVILLDQDVLTHKVTVPVKDELYYFTYDALVDYFNRHPIPELSVVDRGNGITITVNDIKFKADSAEMLIDETERLDRIATALKTLVDSASFTIIVEGHTASVGKPQGEMELSVARAEAIVSELVARGVPKEIFTAIGYGGTVPLASNDTNEGRALNRRVEIIVQPKKHN